MNEQIHNYIQNQLSRASALLEVYTKDRAGNAYRPRYLFDRIKRHIDDFIANKTEIRIYGIPGLRGVGKTTLIAQLYKHLLSAHPNNLLYISGDQVTDLLQTDLYTVLTEYQNIIGTSFENLTQPHFIFIDEIHFDKKWPAVLKWIYDRTRNVFVICTGSSALSLQLQASDLARRIIYEKMYPMKFTEYRYLKNKKASSADEEMAKALKEAMLFGSDARSCFEQLTETSKAVNDYWIGIDGMEIDRYLRFGTMPFALHERDDSACALLTNEIIDRVIERDLPELGKFKQETLSKAKHALFMAAGSDEVSFTSFAKNLTGVSIITLMELFDAFEMSEMLVRVYPYGSMFKKVRKPSKYLFKSPALRYSLLSSVEGRNVYQKYLGKYLEDIVAMYITHDLDLTRSLFYDSTKGGADFIIQMGPRNIVLEVGHGKKGIKQTVHSMKKLSSTHGIVVSKGKLELHENENIVKIPLEMFLMM